MCIGDAGAQSGVSVMVVKMKISIATNFFVLIFQQQPVSLSSANDESISH
jgi:hypothetical protein